jgi:hypothetical protein
MAGQVELTLHSQRCLDRVFRGSHPPDPVLLLGAGASVKSGVPLASHMVSMAAKWAYCEEHGRSFDDPSVTLSDWKPWLSGQAWYRADVAMEEQYPQAIERLLRPRETRRAFFLRALGSAERPSAGYGALAKLIAARTVRHVLTVNFDDLVARACVADRKVLHVASICSPQDLTQFSTDPLHAQVVHLHGSVAHYQDRNLEEETRTLDPEIRKEVMPVLRDHPLVVLGYRGAEASVMIDLLQNGAESAHGFRHGVYWCVLPDAVEHLHPFVRQLAANLGANFKLVEIVGFDDAMTRWSSGVTPARVPEFTARTHEPDVPDLRPAGELGEVALDTRLAEEQLSTYAQSLGLVSRSAGDADGWRAWLTEVRLLRPGDGNPQLTRAARLLFGEEGVVVLEIRGEDAFVPITGNVFGVLQQTLEAIEDFNRPYRLKGPVSEDMRRYDPRAVKELIVNALAHRDYDDERPIRVAISEHELAVVSPGGLVGGLTVQQLGQPHVCAYRNPIVADILYGAGAMDKAGSGLADVVRWTRQAGGEAVFGLTDDELTFVASLRARELEPDPETGTVSPTVEHFTSNVLEIQLDSPIRSASTTCSYRREIYDANPGASLPAFAMQPGRITTFADLTVGPLARHISGPVRSSDASEMSRDADTERILVQLLNSTMFAWARRRGLRHDSANRRLWFPAEAGGPREITYRARVREATRTVAKPRSSRTTGELLYWEHEAVRFSFRHYGDAWGLHLTPCFAFTLDGAARLMKGSRVGPLATRRAAREFNPQVENDLYFWLWVLTGGQPTQLLDDHAVLVRRGFISCDVVGAPVPIGAGEPGEGEPDTESETTDEFAEIAADEEVQT